MGTFISITQLFVSVLCLGFGIYYFVLAFANPGQYTTHIGLSILFGTAANYWVSSARRRELER